jgi:hypothetical protein
VHIGPPNYEGTPRTKKPGRRPWVTYVESALALFVFFFTTWLLLMYHYSLCIGEDVPLGEAVPCDELPVWSGPLLFGGPFVLLGFGLIVIRPFRSPWPSVGAAALAILGFAFAAVFGDQYR